MKRPNSNIKTKHVLLFTGTILIILTLLFIFNQPLSAAAIQEQVNPTNVVQLTGPTVSVPVAPADTSGMPLASAYNQVNADANPTLIQNAFKLPGVVRTAGDLPGLDTVLQSDVGIFSMPAPLTSWEGIPATGVFPPDTNGQIGSNHYVQLVNASGAGTQIRVWDKTGTQLYNFGMNYLWPTGDRCRSYGYGDPVVVYDQMADRWILTQFTNPPSQPYGECFAVSKTNTPTDNPNDWYLYTFNVHTSKFNDYPKIGVWPDGYYMSANQFGASWGGAGVWVFDRAKMLTGQAATFQYFDLYSVNPNYGGLLPSNLMGDTLPPEGAPNYFMAVDMNWSGSDDILHVWEFKTDWDTPANTSFTLVKDLVVAPFDWNFPGSSGAEVPQPDTSQGLDNLSDRLMMHLWYRNFGDHESLVVNHTVNNGSNIHAVRWYEIRGGTVNTTLADAAIYQQGTYAPDNTHRWMGSVAMDHVGNLALGYSVSSSSVYPGIRYAGRLFSDPLGNLSQGEATIIDGTGSQTGSDPYGRGRWGDYSALSVDPVDDCTFWYTTEYMETTSGAGWQTRIASFKFPNCSLEPTGTLSGHITDVDTAADLSTVSLEISASLTQTFQTVSDENGAYSIELPVDTYTVTAATFGYYPETVTNMDVLDGAETTLDFALNPIPPAEVSGYVSDNQTGWPLYASIHITAPDFSTTVFSDPVTGYYSVTLVENVEFDFNVSAVSNGYGTEALNLTPSSGGNNQDFTLDPNLTACSAPGYSFTTSCEIVADGLAVGVVLDANTGTGMNNANVSDDLGHSAITFATPADPDEPDGFYIMGLPTGSHSLNATYNAYGPDTHLVSITPGENTRQNFSLPSARLVPDPDELQAELTINDSLDLMLTISNTGTTTATFDLGSINASASSPSPGKYFIPTRKLSPKHTLDVNALWAFTYQPSPTAKIPAGQVLQTFDPGLSGLWGLGIDPLQGKIWVGSITVSGGSDQLHQFLMDGGNTGQTIDVSAASGRFSADLTFNPFKNLLWQVDVGGSDCIYAISPDSLQITGARICPMIGAPQRGLAYDLTTDTFYLGSWNDGAIHHIDQQGKLLDSKNVNINISGLAFNPMTHHLFALSNADRGYDVYVLDVDSDYAMLGGFDIPGLGDFAQAGMDIDCDGNLWIVDQANNQMIKATSGETGICSWEEISWLSANPLSGSVPAGESQEITFTFDSTGMTPGSYQSQVRVDTDTPYGAFYVSARMIVDQNDYDVSVAPEFDALGGDPGQTITYYLDVTNTGKYADTYDVSLVNSWLTQAAATVGPLDSLETDTITVTVTIPTGALPGDWDAASVTLTSQHDTNVSAQAVLTTTANTYYAVTLTPSQATESAAPGESAAYMLQVNNTGNITDTYDIAVTDATWNVSVAPTVGPLAPGESVYLIVSVEVPLEAQLGDFDIANLTVTSQGIGTSSATSVLTTRFADFKLYLPVVMR